MTKISFIGFGEAAQAFTRGFRKDDASVAISAFDIKTDGPKASGKRDEYESLGVIGKSTIAEACEDSDLILSLVTADQAQVAAAVAAKSDLQNALYFDCNSCAPETKRRAAGIVEAADGRYVDVAIMTPVHPRLHKSPCLLAGPHAEAALEGASSLNMTATVVGKNVGDASTRKMIRSVMVKGLEALTIECFLAARQAGIEQDVLASLDNSYKGFDWPQRAPYMLERAITHGTRRAAEMQEVAKTLSDLGIEPNITEATILRQRETGALGLNADAIGPDDLCALTDAILSAAGQKAE